MIVHIGNNAKRFGMRSHGCDHSFVVVLHQLFNRIGFNRTKCLNQCSMLQIALFSIQLK